METVSFSATEIPIVAQAQVIVCGGGPAGCAAAVAAARSGADTILIEGHGMLGGIWTAGLVGDISDIHLKTGYTRSFIDKMLSQGVAIQRRHTPFCESEETKCFLEDECLNMGVKVRLYTSVIGVRCEHGRIQEVITHSKSGLEAWRANVFIDATGDGDLGALSGCEFEMGKQGKLQPLSLTGLITGIHIEDVTCMDNSVIHQNGSPKKRFLEELHRAGCNPTYSDPSLYRLWNNIFVLSVNHEYGVCASDAQALTDATIHARHEIKDVVSKLRNYGGIWKNIRLLSTSSQIGIREGRRIRGLVSLSLKDLLEGQEQPDGICKSTFPIDVHSTDPSESTSYYNRPAHMKTKPYDIPLRALIAKDLSNLLMAGRCISGDFYAHASYRVTGNAIATGYASGFTAAYSCLYNQNLHDLDFESIAANIRNMCFK